MPPSTTNPLLSPHDALLDMKRSDWLDLTEEVFKEVFKKSPVKRTGYEGLLRNIQAWKAGSA